MDVIGGQAKVQEVNVKAFEFLPHQGAVNAAIPVKLQMKIAIMTPMCQMKDSSFDLESMSSSHARRVSDHRQSRWLEIA